MSLEHAKKQLMDVAEELSAFDPADKMMLYQTLMDYGKHLDPFSEEWKIPENKVRGCSSTVYIHAIPKDGKVYYRGYADALIVKGQLAILVDALSGLTPSEIVSSDSLLDDFVKRTNITSSLTPSRVNGFASIYKKMRELASTTK